MVTSNERALLRELAAEVARIAADPIMGERRALWKQKNQLMFGRPALFVSAEGAWRELLPESTLQCRGQWARRAEWHLRSRIYMWEHFDDDRVIEPVWVVPKRVTISSWGLEPKFRPSTAEGAWGYDPVIHAVDDLEQLTLPVVSYDEEGSRRDHELAWDVFDGLLDVQLLSVHNVEFHLMNQLCKLRGLEQIMLDMYDQPQLVHKGMERLTQGYLGILEQYRQLRLFDETLDDLHHLGGDVGFSCTGVTYRDDTLHPEDPECLQIWAAAEAQEMTHVSPAMVREFVLPYERKLLAPFGFVGYGCCEDLSKKLGDVLQIPNLRRVSVSPWADVETCAAQIGQSVVLAWKPHPGTVAGDFDPNYVREYLAGAMGRAMQYGCITEVVLKDTHTCSREPERFDIWTKIAKEIALQYA